MVVRELELEYVFHAIARSYYKVSNCDSLFLKAGILCQSMFRSHVDLHIGFMDRTKVLLLFTKHKPASLRGCVVRYILYVLSKYVRIYVPPRILKKKKPSLIKVFFRFLDPNSIKWIFSPQQSQFKATQQNFAELYSKALT